MKKRMMIIMLALGAAVSSPAQSNANVNHLNISVGALYERGFDATISVEHYTKYHNAWEVFANGYIQWAKDEEAGHITRQSFWHNYFTYNIGIAYKPCIVRGRNHHGNLRIGVSAGSDTEDIIGAAHIGYEHSYALKGGWELLWQVKEDIVFRGEDLLRTGIVVGVKIPL